MPLLTESSLTAVRDTVRIENVVSQYVTLKRSGSTVKGLCPFHDEKSPSFQINTERNIFHCFGCGEGGDVIDFLCKIEGMNFREAVERLAETYGVELLFETTNTPTLSQPENKVPRKRLLEANIAAQKFYADQLLTPQANIARNYLKERGFGKETAENFGCGFAPNSWDTLTKYLLQEKFTSEEIEEAGLGSTRNNQTGLIDRFRNRLIFPIKDQTGHIIGFGARKLSADPNDDSPKYLNTPETNIYHKSKVLFGLDKARKTISQTRRVVVVEGYTDVMACHLAGETTAIATCGTAFGEDHIHMIRRILGDDGTGGEVIYTFDGDAAGQKAALKAFSMDSHFQTRTSVAVEPDGLDPCEVRMKNGDQGINELIENRVPLFEFAIKSAFSEYNFSVPEERSNALNRIAPILSDIKHLEVREGYIRQVGRWTGIEPDIIRKALKNFSRNPTESVQSETEIKNRIPDSSNNFEKPQPDSFLTARNVLKVILRNPKFVEIAQKDLNKNFFPHPVFQEIWSAVIAGYKENSDNSVWLNTIQNKTTNPTIKSVINELSVEPFLTRTGEINYEIASKSFLALVLETCDRQQTRIQTELSNPDLTSEEAANLMSRLQTIHHKKQDAMERSLQIEGVNF